MNIRSITAAFLSVALLMPAPALAWNTEVQDLSQVEVTFDEGVAPGEQTKGPSTSEPSTWAKSEVESAVAAGLVPTLTGDPKYTDAITREQFAELAIHTANALYGEGPDMAKAKSFTDCDNPNVIAASAAGIVDGVGDGKFDPKQTTNREQIATMIVRTIHYLEGDTRVYIEPFVDLSSFADAGQVSAWAYDSMGMLAHNGLMKGTSNTTISPQEPCTVEQSILLLYRVYERVQQSD